VFSTAQFQAWVKECTVPFVGVETRIEGRKHDDVAAAYGLDGAPWLAVLDADGELLTAEVGRDAYSMRTVVEWAPRYRELAQSASPDPAAWWMARFAMGKLPYARAKEERAALQLSSEAAAKIDQMLFVEEINELARQSLAEVGAPSTDASAAEVYRLYQLGRRLPAGVPSQGFFDEMLLHAATANRDADAFFHSYGRVVATIEAEIARAEQFVAELKAGQGDADSPMIQIRNEDIAMARARLDALRRTAATLR